MDDDQTGERSEHVRTTQRRSAPNINGGASSDTTSAPSRGGGSAKPAEAQDAADTDDPQHSVLGQVAQLNNDVPTVWTLVDGKRWVLHDGRGGHVHVCATATARDDDHSGGAGLGFIDVRLQLTYQTSIPKRKSPRQLSVCIEPMPAACYARLLRSSPPSRDEGLRAVKNEDDELSAFWRVTFAETKKSLYAPFECTALFERLPGHPVTETDSETGFVTRRTRDFYIAVRVEQCERLSTWKGVRGDVPWTTWQDVYVPITGRSLPSSYTPPQPGNELDVSVRILE